jgi:hypothetical protein
MEDKLQECFDKLRRRIAFLEHRLEKLDGIKKIPPTYPIDNGFPIA